MGESFSGLWRDGQMLVVAMSWAKFPGRCYKSNVPVTSGPTPVEVIYEQPGLRREKIALQLPLTDAWRAKNKSKRGVAVLVTSILLFLSCGVGIVVVHELFSLGLFLAVLGLIAGPILIFLQSGRIARINAIDGDFAWLKGAHPEFLSALPEWSTANLAASIAARESDQPEEPDALQPCVSDVQTTVQYDQQSYGSSRAFWVKYAYADAILFALTVFT